MMRTRLTGQLLGLALFIATPVAAQTSQPAMIPIVENEFVQVSQVTFYPGKTPLEMPPSGLPALIVVLHSKAFVPAQGASSEPNSWSFQSAKYLAGSGVLRSGPFDEKETIRQMFITLKSWPPSAPFEKDAVKLDPAHNKVVFENDRVRVVHLNFPPGASGPVVDKRMRVIVMLTDSHAIVTRPDGTTAVRDGKVGAISYSKGGSQATLNAGTTPLENIVVELKGK
ncbi:MAG TPA: hypothetical protein VN862_00700 [Candidatus Acidoferrales bacterium]|nr:hypothetical protein [Candidatus Acidoferrales bacterium]